MTTLTPVRPSLAPYHSYPLQRLLQRTAHAVPDKLAIIDGDRSITYYQFNEYTDRFAAALVSIGVSKGDSVALLAPNCLDFEVAFFGVMKAGAVVSTVNSAYREREIAHQVNVSKAQVLIVHESQLQTAEAARDAIPGLKRVIVIKPNSSEPDSFWGMMGRYAYSFQHHIQRAAVRRA